MPNKSNPESTLFVAAVDCHPDEELAACAIRAFPYIPQLNKNQKIVYLADKNFRMPFCGMKDYDGRIAETGGQAVGLSRDPYFDN